MSEEIQMTNPLIDDLRVQGVIPDVRIGLPTMYVPYPEGTFEEGTDLRDIPVGVLRVLEENAFRDPFLFARGKAIPRMIRHLCPNILEPERLSEIDVEAILMAARIARFGTRMKFRHTCQNPTLVAEAKDGRDGLCHHENELRIDLQGFIMDRYGPIQNLDRYRVTLPRLQQTVQLKPMRYRDGVRAMRKVLDTNRRMDGLREAPVEEVLTNEGMLETYAEVVQDTILADIDALANRIMFVETSDGRKASDPEFILEWLKRIPTDQIGLIREVRNRLSLDLRRRSQQDYQCGRCGYQNTVRVQLDPQRLFMPAEASDRPKTPSAKSPGTGKKGKPHSRISRR